MSNTLSAFNRFHEADQHYFNACTTDELQAARAEIATEANNAIETCDRLKRSAGVHEFTKKQKRDFDLSVNRADDCANIQNAIDNALRSKDVDRSQILQVSRYGDPGVNGANWFGSNDEYRPGVPLTRSQSVAGYVRSKGLIPYEQDNLSLGKYIRGAVLGDWKDSDAERRAMSEGTSTAGGYMVPTILSAQLIDLARAKTRVIEAGAQLLPMSSVTVDVARWEGDPVPAWRAENAAIAATDGVLGRVRLTAKSLAGYVVLSRELLEDAQGLDAQLNKAFSDQLALAVDKAALMGTGADNQPQGIKGTSGVSNISMAASGVIQNYNWISDAVGALKQANEEPTAVIMAPRTEKKLGQLSDTTGQPMAVPPYLANLPMLSTTQIPVNLGGGSNASEMYCGDFGQLIVGVRTDVQISLLTERWADQGQIGVLVWYRGDVGVARPAAFNVTTGIL